MTQARCPISPPFSSAAEAAEASRSTREASARQMADWWSSHHALPGRSAPCGRGSVGSHLGMRCSRLLLASNGNYGGNRATGAADGGASGESGADMQGTWNIGVGKTHAPASSSRVLPRQGKEFGRFVSDPGMTGSPIRVHCPVSRHAVNVTTGPLRALWVRYGLLRNTLT